MTTQYPLNHSAFTDPFSVFYTLYHYLFVSQSLVVLPILVNQNSAFYNNPQLSHAAQSFGYFKPLKPSPLFNRSPALLPRLATLKFGLQLFAAPIQNIGNHLINHLISSFDFKAAKATNGQRVLMIETLKTENQWSLTLLIVTLLILTLLILDAWADINLAEDTFHSTSLRAQSAWHSRQSNDKAGLLHKVRNDGVYVVANDANWRIAA